MCDEQEDEKKIMEKMNDCLRVLKFLKWIDKNDDHHNFKEY